MDSTSGTAESSDILPELPEELRHSVLLVTMGKTIQGLKFFRVRHVISYACLCVLWLLVVVVFVVAVVVVVAGIAVAAVLVTVVDVASPTCFTCYSIVNRS